MQTEPSPGRVPFVYPINQQPQPYILDSRARTPLHCKLIRNGKSGILNFPIIVCGDRKSLLEDALDRMESLQKAGCTILSVPLDEKSEMRLHFSRFGY